MPPFQSRSTGARSRARISSFGVSVSASMPSDRPRLGRERDRLRRAREHAAAGRDQPGVVVGPGRARQLRRAARARAKLAAGSGSGSRKTCRWSKAPTSWMCRESSMPLPNTSPDMSPIPTTVKSVRLDVDAELAEVALDRLPRAARGDAHLLVVVAGRAAGGEGVAEPEAVLGRDRVRDVGERRRALVGGDDEVRVVARRSGRRPAAARPRRRRACPSGRAARA